ncbi:thiol reductant ABC exporter subunit CydC [Kineococcus radiotolerans]|uniref:ABC transporter CydDC cysteine exporter (CydDC-E) family permease/ATP-binding protein CydD n=1 Tax=Kineococcus radiotolerans (strain ATCC BAA-149 / DSM 14245 / SRS30216) TaxID=266940 RepID=A6W8I7_KINRD|nr:thiol reductant ABC exporter subunit CydC [Kineococcus radiotolerans]ABS03126.1 ABC transporter CydDC cysteine exporter (CydDC-E) family permease/ATP-binding protein CydD [Kineococcus radiotolerans SRS30216 = ATCC BAA-149]
MSAATRPRGPLDPRLLRHARPARAGIAAIGAVEVVAAGLLLTQAFALTDLVVALWRGTAASGALALLAGAVGGRVLTSWAAARLSQRTATAVRRDLHEQVLARVLRLGPAWVERFGRARASAVLTQGLPALDGWFTRYLPALVPGALLPPVVLLLLARLDLRSALTVALTLPLVPVFAVLLGRAAQARADRQWHVQRTLSAHFLDTVRGLPTLRAHRRAQRQVAAVAAVTDASRRATMSVLRVAFLSSTALDLVGTLSTGLVAVTAGMRLAGGTLDLRTALLVILLTPEAYRPLREVGARFHDSADATAVIDDVDEVLTAPVPPVAAGTAAGVRLRGVRVRRDHGGDGGGAGGDVLDGVDLDVAPGELHALAGESGAGKTTLARVAAGVLVPDGGSVEHTLDGLLHLPQRPSFPHAGTVAQAVRAGRTATDEEVRAALDLAAAPDLALDTALGEDAAGLSAGQRQRVALARTFLTARTGTGTLVLDEPTAHLDPAAEAVVVAALRALAHERGWAVLVVAHRPALLAAADRTTTLTRPAAPPASPAMAPSPAPARPGSGAARPGAVADLAGASRGPRRGAGALAVLAGVAAVLAAATLTAAATWLIVRAADRPPVLTLSVAAVVVRASATARPLLVYAERLLSHDTAFARLARWRSDVVAALIPRLPGPLSRRRSGRSGELLVQLVEDVDARVDGLLRFRHPVTVTVTALVLALAAAAAVDVRSALAALPAVAVVVLAAPALAARAERRDRAHRTEVGALAAATVETLDAVEDLRTLGSADPLATVRRRVSALARAETRRARAAAATAALTALGTGGAVLALALVAGLTAPAGGPGVAWVAAVVLAGLTVADAARGLPDAARARERAREARRRSEALLATPPAAVEPSAPRAPGPPRDLVLSVRGLRAGWGEDCLRGLDLDLRRGEVVAVRGASGSGKSTLAAVLQRFLDPRAGRVLLDGVEVTGLAGDDVRAVVGRVADDEHVFATTLRENLLLAAPGAGDEALTAALHRVRLDDWSAALPRGLDTRLGDGGEPMSGGERRRLAMARALLADVRVLVLDEPSEGLDEETGTRLLGDLLDARGEQAVLLLAHRAEGVDRADRVLDLVDGALTGVPTLTRSV